jgi:hypothetical protein
MPFVLFAAGAEAAGGAPQQHKALVEPEDRALVEP